MDLALLAFGDVSANRLRRTLDRFGGYFQPGQDFHLLTAVIERRLVAHQSLHAAYAGREVTVFDIEFAVHGELAVVTMRAKVPRAPQFHLAQGRENAPQAQSAIARQAAAPARDGPLFGVRLGELQQLREHRRSRPVRAVRKAISTASRSIPPVCFRSAKMRLSSVATSRAISVWIASAVFFPGA